MQIFQLVGIALVTGIAALILKSTRPELAFAVTIAGGIILLLFAFNMLRETFSVFEDITQKTGIDTALVKILLKMLGIGYLVQFSADILSDFGQNSVADKLVFCGKILILLLSIPILESLLGLIDKLIALI